MNNDVLVIAEHFRGRLQETTFELLGKARELAVRLPGKVKVLMVGDALQGLVGELGGADTVLLAERPEFREFVPEVHAAVVEKGIKEQQPRLVLLGSTSSGMDTLSTVAAGAGLPCIDSCTQIVTRDGQLIATSQIYGGKAYAEVLVPDSTTLVAVVPGAFPLDAGRGAGKPEVHAVEIPPDLPVARSTFRALLEPPAGDVDITKENILVAVGRGIQDAQNMPLAEELAAALGGATCASRPVIDQGWLPLTRQVGKSGMTVKPKLYLALGISGAPEHVEGMRQAELIVAVNTDAKAPILAVAHYGIVADALELLPLLTEEVQRRALKKAS